MQYGRCRQFSSQPVIARYKRARNEGSRIRKEEQRIFIKNIVDNADENP